MARYVCSFIARQHHIGAIPLVVTRFHSRLKALGRAAPRKVKTAMRNRRDVSDSGFLELGGRGMLVD